MTWLLLSLLAPFIWSIANYLDKYLLSDKAEPGGGSGGLIILSSFMSLLFAGCIYLALGSAVMLPSRQINILILSGVFEAMYIYFYFQALEIESTSTVISLFQFAPIFGLLFGYVFLSEIPSGTQLLAIVIILIGTLCIVIKKNEFHLKSKVIWLMTASTICVGLFGTLFKVAGDGLPLWVSVFWQYMGIGLMGFVFFFASRKYQKEFYAMIKGKFVALVALAEVLNISAVLVTNAAIVLAPVALVLSVGSVQPVIVLIEGLLLAVIYPKLFAHDKPQFKFQYVLGIVLVVIGGFLINF